MKLITEEFKKLMAEYPLYSQEKRNDPMVIARFFHPACKGVWLITEYSPDDQLAFGYVMNMGQDEFGYVSLKEMEMVSASIGIPFERDVSFEPKPLSQCKKEHS